MHHNQKQKHINQKATLYRFVFDALYIKGLILLLLFFFLFHPAIPVFAAEEEVADESNTEEVSPQEDAKPEVDTAIQEEVEVVEPEPVVNEVEVDSVVEETSTSTSEDPALLVDGEQENNVESQTEEIIPQASSTNPMQTEQQNEIITPVASTTTSTDESRVLTETASTTVQTSSSTDAGSTGTNEVATTTATSTIEDIESAPDISLATSTTNEDVEIVTNEPEVKEEPVVSVEDDTEEQKDKASSTDDNVAAPVEFSVSSDDPYKFSEAECVSVGDGSYYCNRQSQTNNDTENAVFSQPDTDGDLEIFIKQNGEQMQLTHNIFDDASPYFDEADNQIVFHRLIEGRYQIVRYDLDTNTEEQLTYSSENNMEPAQADGITVWQQWVTDNWEIALLEDGEIHIISSNKQHDIAPVVRDGFVMWHTTDVQGEKLLSVYDITTKVSTTVADPDGGQVDNPRFVLVYDTTFDNGDVVTKEYDPLTGEIKPIGSKPTPAPTQVPSSDTTGEAMALINTKTNTRSENIEDTEWVPSNVKASSTPNTDSVDSGESAPASTTTIQTDIPTLDVSTTSSQTLPLTEFDIIVEPYVPATSTTPAEVNDLATTTQQN